VEFNAQFDELFEVVVLYVRVDPEQPFAHQFDEGEDVFGVGQRLVHREVLGRGELRVHPVQQVFDLLFSRYFNRGFDLDAVRPKLLILAACAHRRTHLHIAQVHQDPENQTDFFEEFLHHHDYPVGQIVADRHFKLA